MHHFIYPSQDTFITNTIGFDSSNFGLDEILRIGTETIAVRVVNPTTTYQFPPNTLLTNFCVQGFSGSLSTSSFYGTASFVDGQIFNTSQDPVTFIIEFFSGSFVGSLNGWINGTPFSSSNFTGSIDGFSGSIIVQTNTSDPNWNDILNEFDNWMETWDEALAGSGSIIGHVSGSLTSPFIGVFNGSASGYTGKVLTGIVNGVEIFDYPNTTVSNGIFNSRALVQFDITSISKSIANGDIANPNFKLKLKVAREKNLPINYNIYIFPISESWVMGDGYLSDDGSSIGASWLYRDYSGGTLWATTGSSYIQSLCVTQSFNYEVGDINMDVTSIVTAWISGTIQNNGFLLLSSDEFVATGSGMSIRFFSRDTNTIYEPILDVGWNGDITTINNGNGGVSWFTGSVTTASVNISTIGPGISGSVCDSASISGSIYGGFSGVGNITVQSNFSASGLVDLLGNSGLINGMVIYGNMSGSISSSIVTIYKICNSCTPIFNAGFNYPGGQCQTQYQGMDIYGWGNPFNTFNQYDWWSDAAYQEEFGPGFAISSCYSGSHSSSMVTMSLIMGTLIDGGFSGSTFTSSFINGYKFGMGYLIGGWTEQLIDGTVITARYPFKPMFPNAINVNFSGLYVNGDAFGSLSSISSSVGLLNYGIFDGVFIDGPIIGSKIHAPFSGSIMTSSYSYTSSITIVSSSLSAVDFNSPFTTTLQNIQSTVKSGDIIRVNVFARPEFPLKNFNRQTQFTQFLIPEYLPTSSYYAIKDNQTDEMILDFDEYTRLNCDTNGNYFLLDTTGFPQERYFKILIRTNYNGNIYTFDKNGIFKIVR